MDWDDKTVIQGAKGEVELQFHAVQHWSARTPWDRYETLWGGWAVLHPEFRFWFSGDLGYSKDTQDVGKRLGSVDLAAIAIGAYEPRWFMQTMHVNPAEAVKVMQEVGAKHALAVHWGTFERLTDESLDEPPQVLKKVLDAMPEPRPDFRVLAHGQTWKFD
jgi:L-ascorbate metabolism protein UlaG (beta-lactamase superfamily)